MKPVASLKLACLSPSRCYGPAGCCGLSGSIDVVDFIILGVCGALAGVAW